MGRSKNASRKEDDEEDPDENKENKAKKKKVPTCENCGATYSCRQHLHRHKKVCLGTQSYPCSKCKYTATRKDNLDRHMRKCTGEKDEKICKVCGKLFLKRSNLNRHVLICEEQVEKERKKIPDKVKIPMKKKVREHNSFTIGRADNNPLDLFHDCGSGEVLAEPEDHEKQLHGHLTATKTAALLLTYFIEENITQEFSHRFTYADLDQVN